MTSIETSRSLKELFDADLVRSARIVLEVDSAGFHTVEIVCVDRTRVFEVDSQAEALRVLDHLCKATTAFQLDAEYVLDNTKAQKKSPISIPDSDDTELAVAELLSS